MAHAEEVVSFDANSIMASLNVNCLFINIPLYETIENCTSGFFSNNMVKEKISKENIKELLKFAAYQSHLSHLIINIIVNLKPLEDPFLANAFLRHFEKQWPSGCLHDFRP